jgi:hypothetical protein
MELTKGIPEEVELMAAEFMRTCQRHGVCLSGFMFAPRDEKNPESRSFVYQFGTITDTGEALKNLHETLCTFVSGSGVKTKKLWKNDA